jgi:hypothetical protein
VLWKHSQGLVKRPDLPSWHRLRHNVHEKKLQGNAKYLTLEELAKGTGSVFLFISKNSLPHL